MDLQFALGPSPSFSELALTFFVEEEGGMGKKDGGPSLA